jgi:hypothetical protein
MLNPVEPWVPVHAPVAMVVQLVGVSHGGDGRSSTKLPSRISAANPGSIPSPTNLWRIPGIAPSRPIKSSRFTVVRRVDISFSLSKTN